MLWLDESRLHSGFIDNIVRILTVLKGGFYSLCIEAYHASSGANTSGLVKRLRHCSRLKCPALAVSLKELGSSS